MNNLIHDLQQKELKTMYQKQGITYLGLFGSSARGESTSQSDVDLLIDFEGHKSLFDLDDLKFYFQDMLGRKIDLAMKGHLKKAFEPYIMKDLITIYEKS